MAPRTTSNAAALQKLGGGGEKCILCVKTCFPAESMYTSSGSLFHQGCFRCTQCRRPLTLSTYAEDAATKRLYCQPHYNQLAQAAGLEAVARGGVDGTKSALVEKRKNVEIAEEVERLKVGSNVWVSVDELSEPPAVLQPGVGEPFVLGTLTSVGESLREDEPATASFTVELAKEAVMVTAPAAAVSLADRDGTKVDNLQLLHLTEANLLHNLRSRFEARHIYTWTGGHELLALNPYESLDGLYELPPAPTGSSSSSSSSSTAQGSTTAAFDDTQPHAFSVGERLYLGAAKGEAQAVVISGESGAGKTETNKFLLSYLRWRSGGSEQEKAVAERVTSAITVANRVLEAAGNASTIANDNSSRFGKYLELFLGSASQEGGAAGAITRGDFRCFLLERARVVRQSDGERNFHIFYQLLCGMDAAGAASPLRALGLSAAPGAHKLAPGLPPPATDARARLASQFQQLASDLQSAGVAIEQLSEVLAAILDLGDVGIVDGEEEGSSAIDDAAVESRGALKAAARHLGVTAADLEQRMTSRWLSVGKDDVQVPLTPQEARAERDALAKAAYQRLFAWLVQRLGDMLSPDAETSTTTTSTSPSASASASGPSTPSSSSSSSVGSIGLLDVFGFETLQVNSLEQLCINFANERLHNLFVSHVFEGCPEELLSIVSDEATRIDNLGCCDLIAAPPHGIIHLLDHQCRAPQASEASFFLQVNLKHQLNKFCVAPRRTRTCAHDSQSGFIIKHFAGDVMYTAGHWLTTNNDSLQNPRWFTQSSSELISLLFSDPSLQPASQQSRAGASFASVGARFSADLSALIGKLTEADCHFVRCMKPNMSRQPNLFDVRYVQSRVRAAGSLAALRFTKRLQGVVEIRLSTLLRLKEQQSLPSHLKEAASEGDSASFATALLLALGLTPSTFRLGPSTVTVASALCPFLAEMEAEGSTADADAAKVIARRVQMVADAVAGKDTAAAAAGRRREERKAAVAAAKSLGSTGGGGGGGGKAAVAAAVVATAAAKQPKQPKPKAAAATTTAPTAPPAVATPPAAAPSAASAEPVAAPAAEPPTQPATSAPASEAAAAPTPAPPPPAPPQAASSMSLAGLSSDEEDEDGEGEGGVGAARPPAPQRVGSQGQMLQLQHSSTTVSTLFAKRMPTSATLLARQKSSAAAATAAPMHPAPGGGALAPMLEERKKRAQLWRHCPAQAGATGVAAVARPVLPPAGSHHTRPPSASEPHWKVQMAPRQEERLTAIQSLASNGHHGGGSLGVQSALALYAALCDQSEEVRKAALEAATSLQLRALLTLGLEDPSREMRRLAARGLAECAGETAAFLSREMGLVRALDDLLFHEHDDQLSLSLVDALGGALLSSSSVSSSASSASAASAASAPPYAKAALLATAMAYGGEATRMRAAELAAGLGDSYVLSDVALFDSNPKMRLHAVGLLKTLKASAELHRVALADPDVAVRLAAVEALISLAAVSALVAALDDPELQVRMAATEGLGKLKLAEELHAHSLHDEAVAVRLIAAEALFQLKKPHLLSAALDDAAVQLRLRVVNLLDELACCMHCYEPLAKAAKHDPETRVRATALEALAKHKQIGAIADGPLRDADEGVARRAVDLLGGLCAAAPLGACLTMDGERPEIRLAATGWLVQLRAPLEMLPALFDAEVDVRKSAAEGVQQMILEINQQSSSSLSSSSLSSSSLSASSSGNGGVGPRASHHDLRLQYINALQTLLADTKRPLRHTAARSLELLGDADWLEAFPHEDGTLGSEALLSSQRPETEELLVNLLTVEQPEDRREAARLIGLRRDITSAAALRVAAADRDGSVRVQAIKALGTLAVPDEESTLAVIGALTDRSAQVRHQAVIAAGRIGSLDAVAPVVERLQDKQELVASAASETLHALQTGESLAALVECLLSHASPLVVKGAIASLGKWRPARLALDAMLASNLLGPKAANAKQVRTEAKVGACEVVGRLAWGGSATAAAASPAAAPASSSDDDGGDGREEDAAKEAEEEEVLVVEEVDKDGQLAAVTALQPMLEARDEGVRATAAAALGQLARPEALKPLAALLKDKASTVVDAATASIGALDWSSFLSDDEVVLFGAPVLKKQEKLLGVGALNIKQLMYTSQPRLFYVDAVTFKPKDCDLKAEPVLGKDGSTGAAMQLYQSGKAQKVTCLTTTADKWVDALAGKPVLLGADSKDFTGKL